MLYKYSHFVHFDDDSHLKLALRLQPPRLAHQHPASQTLSYVNFKHCELVRTWKNMVTVIY